MTDQTDRDDPRTEDGEGRPSNDNEETGFERFPLEEWDALSDRVQEMEEWVAATKDQVAFDEGEARFVLTSDGTVSGSRPGHEFAVSDLDAIEIATDGSAVRVYDPEQKLEYVFEL